MIERAVGRRSARLCLLLALGLGSLPALPADTGPSISLSGSMGDKALLVIDGTPRTVGVGSTVQGVKLLRMGGGEAEIEVGGKRSLLRIGQAPATLTGAAPAVNGTQIVLTAGLGGHFTTNGSINGRAVEFLVDTGATSVALSQADAERIGLNFRSGTRGVTQTANGPVPVNRVMLTSVRIGDVEVYNVEAVVIPGLMSHVLLGNSFLTRFQMRRDNDTLTLERRL